MKQKQENKKMISKIVANAIFLLGIIIPFGFGCQQISATGYYDQALSACENLKDEAYWERIEADGTDFTDCNHIMGIQGSVTAGTAYSLLYTSFSTSAIFLGFMIVYNKKPLM